MEQDSRTMSLLFKVNQRLKNQPMIQIYSSNFTEEPGIYIEGPQGKEFIPSETKPDELEMKMNSIESRFFG